MHRCALQRPEIADAFDDADQRVVTMRIGADRARVAAVEIAAHAARLHRARRLGQRRGERQHARLRLLQHLQRGTARTARPHAGQSAPAGRSDARFRGRPSWPSEQAGAPFLAGGGWVSEDVEPAGPCPQTVRKVEGDISRARHPQNGSFIPGGSCMPPVTFCISAAVAASSFCRALAWAATIRSSSISASAGIDHLRIDLDPPHVALAVQRDLDQPGAGLAFDLHGLQLGLHLLHLGLHLLGLLHQAGRCSSFVKLHLVGGFASASASGASATAVPAVHRRRRRCHARCRSARREMRP